MRNIVSWITFEFENILLIVVFNLPFVCWGCFLFVCLRLFVLLALSCWYFMVWLFFFHSCMLHLNICYDLFVFVDSALLLMFFFVVALFATFEFVLLLVNLNCLVSVSLFALLVCFDVDFCFVCQLCWYVCIHGNYVCHICYGLQLVVCFAFAFICFIRGCVCLFVTHVGRLRL